VTAAARQATPVTKGTVDVKNIMDTINVDRLIRAFQVCKSEQVFCSRHCAQAHGHSLASLDPLGLAHVDHSFLPVELSHAYYGFSKLLSSRLHVLTLLQRTAT
jgi:hypothetical protein